MFAAVIRVFQREPARAQAVIAALYAAGAMLYRAYVAHTGVVDVDVLAAAVVALYGVWVRSQVTPVAAPRDAKGRELHPL